MALRPVYDWRQQANVQAPDLQVTYDFAQPQPLEQAATPASIHATPPWVAPTGDEPPEGWRERYKVTPAMRAATPFERMRSRFEDFFGAISEQPLVQAGVQAAEDVMGTLSDLTYGRVGGQPGWQIGIAPVGSKGVGQNLRAAQRADVAQEAARFASAKNVTPRPADPGALVAVERDPKFARYQARWERVFTNKGLERGYAPEVVDDAKQIINTTIDLFQAHPDILPLQGARKASGKPAQTIHKNEDFVWTADVNRTCKRVLQYWDTIRSVEQRIQRPMNADEMVLLGQQMRRDGDIPGCVFCYVEAGRRARANMLHALTTQSVPDIAASGKKGSLLEYAEQRDTLLQQLGWVTPDGAPDLRRFAALMVDPKGLDQARQAGGPLKDLIRLTNKYSGGANSTALDPNGQYNHRLLRWSEEEISDLNARAGLRMASATDLDPTQLVELNKIIADATLRKLAAHQYTKEPYTALIYGDTGLKINESIAVNWDGKKFVSDDVNGMPLDIALKLRQKYPHVGTMLVAKNLEQLEWALKNPKIDMMIPHHAANWAGGVSRYGVFDLDDFQEVQHERWSDPTKAPVVADAKAKSGFRRAHPSEVFGDRAFWFKTYLEQAKGDERKAVDLYLQFCRQNGVIPKFDRGTYTSHVTGKTEVFPGYTAHPGYAKLLKDYARTDSPQMPLDITKIQRDRMGEYIDRFVEAGGWANKTANPRTVRRMAQRLRSGKPITPEEMARIEEALRQEPPALRGVDTLESLGSIRSTPTTTSSDPPGKPIPLASLRRRQ